MKTFEIMEFCSLTIKDLASFLEKEDEKSFRAKQIYNWSYQKKKYSFDKMTNLNKDLRESLSKNFEIFSLKLVKTIISEDSQTYKFLFELSDGFCIETVLIKSFKRNTICLSTQVGCKIGCTFCASCKKGFFRNLKTFEIIEQLLQVLEALKEERISNVVFMGMGEPLLNTFEVFRAIKILNEKEGLNISQRSISISTVGILRGLNELIKSDLKINLMLSLHAPTDQLRGEIIPYSKRYKIENILKLLEKYFQKTKRDICLEYILLKDVNDNFEQAEQLDKLIKVKKNIYINLIPYNPVKNYKNYKAPDGNRIRIFKSFLKNCGFNVIQRYEKGKEIKAACGQLALNKNNSFS